VVGRRGFAVGVAIVGLLVLAPGALARNAYVADSGDGTVAVFDTSTNAVSAVLPVGGEPVDVAISPNGGRAYVANKGADSVAVIDTATNAVVAAVQVGSKPLGVAASPDGHRVYVANSGDDTVSAIDTGLNAVVASIPVGKEPDGVAVTPDGTRLLVAQRGGDVAILDTGANAIVGSLPDSLEPSRLAVTPDGGRAFVTNAGSTSLSIFSPASGSSIVAPVSIGAKPAGIAIAPRAQVAYVAAPANAVLAGVDTSLALATGPIAGFRGAGGVAIRPDGLQGYVTDATGSAVTILDAANNFAAGAIPVGAEPSAVAVVPDQGPRASMFVSPARKRAKKPVTFNGVGSRDPDGKIVNYAWDFGDGARIEGSQPTRVHRYRKPGEYQVTLTVTDEEGCSTALVYTGQTAACNGSPLAVASTTIEVDDTAGPIVRLAGAKRQGLRRRVLLRARCPREPCAMSAGGRLVTSVESAAGTRHRSLRLVGARAPGLSSAWRKLRLRVPGGARRAARRALLAGGEAKLKLSVSARDRDGEVRLARRKVELVLR
jgi:YVTN family beta-propeller protein